MGDAEQQPAVGHPVIAVHLADIAAVGNFGGIGGRFPADVGSRRVGGADQAGEVENAFAGRAVFAETESAFAQLHFAAVPVLVAPTIAGDAEQIVMLFGQPALSQPDSMAACARITTG